MIEFTDYRTIWFLLSKIDKKWKNEKVILNRNRIFEQKSCSIVVVRFKCGKIKEWSKSRIWFVSRPQENVPFILNKIYHGVDGYEITSFGDRYGSPRFGWSFYSRFDSVLVSFFVFSTTVAENDKFFLIFTLVQLCLIVIFSKIRWSFEMINWNII